MKSLSVAVSVRLGLDNAQLEELALAAELHEFANSVLQRPRRVVAA